MKRLLFICVILLFVSSACQQTVQYIKTPGSLNVIVEDDSEFPEFLVGKWESDKEGWGFIFEQGGDISVARISMGRTEVTPGKVTKVPTITDGEAIFVPGDWQVIYLPADRELTVDIIMNYIRIEMIDQALQGKTRDIITGTVSEDGKLWRTVVSSFPEYELFPTDPNDLPFTRDVNFVKIEEEK